MFSWYVLSAFIFRTDLFPTPVATLTTLWQLLGTKEIWLDILASLGRVGVGLILAVLIGITTGLLTSLNKQFELALIPAIGLFRSFPPVALIPLMIVWFGINDNGKIIAIMLTSFPPICMEIFFGIQQMPIIFVRKARLLTNDNLKILTQVYIPYSLPYLLQGIRFAIHISLIMLFVTELSGSSQGLGYFISTTQLAYRIDQMIAGLLILSSVGWIADYLVVKIFQKSFVWLNA